MGSKHTPSPWVMDKSSSDTDIYVMASNMDIAKVTIENDEGKANANLIVAAPEMLQEMKSLAKALEDVHELPQSFYDAIKKAEGR